MKLGFRGQTPQDYLAGIVVFIFTISLIFGLLPQFTTPYKSGNAGGTVAQSDRIAQEIISNHSTVDQENYLNTDSLESVLSKNESELAQRFGLSGATSINISVETLDGAAFITNATGSSLASSESATGNSVTSSARIIRLSNDTHTCQPACRLVVRLW